MELASIDDGIYREYERLIIERDDLRKAAGQIWTTYNAEFGQLISEIFVLKIECIKRKKIIAYYQIAINRGGVIDGEAMHEQIEGEVESYYHELEQMLEDAEKCRNAELSSEYDVMRSKELYHRLVKLFHPDIFPETDRQEKLKELWNRVVEAYGNNDCKALSELEVLVRRALSELGGGEIKVEIPDISDKINELKREIDEIKHTEPYIFRYILEDKSKKEKKKAELAGEYKAFKSYLDQLCRIIQEILLSGDIIIKWELN